MIDKDELLKTDIYEQPYQKGIDERIKELEKNN